MTAPRDFVKSGMIVEMNDSDLYMVVDVCGVLWLLDTNTDSYPLSEYNEELKNMKHSSDVYTIKYVYRFAEDMDEFLSEWRDRDNLKVVWERKETKEMTVEEISKALGYEVKVVR